jgi:hypothetical protein
MISILLGIAFIALSIPETYIYTAKVMKTILPSVNINWTGMNGVFIHACIFILIYEILTRTKYTYLSNDKKLNFSNPSK